MVAKKKIVTVSEESLDDARWCIRVRLDDGVLNSMVACFHFETEGWPSNAKRQTAIRLAMRCARDTAFYCRATLKHKRVQR